MKDIIVKTRNRVWMRNNRRKRVSNKGQRCDGVGNIGDRVREQERERNGNGSCYATNVIQSRKWVSSSPLSSMSSLSPFSHHLIVPLSRHYLCNTDHQDDWYFSSKRAENGWISKATMNDLLNVSMVVCVYECVRVWRYNYSGYIPFFSILLIRFGVEYVLQLIDFPTELVP